VGRELAGKTLVIVGCGKIGTKVAKSARYGFKMRVVGHDVARPSDARVLDEFTTDFAEAVRAADFVSLHAPDAPTTRDMINAGTLALLPATAILVNTARGALVDENALYDAIAGNALAGAALDVFKTEPYVPADPARDLRRLERVLATPHIGSSTAEACERMAAAALESIRAGTAGGTPNIER
jgi:phosphoglycerate dehydrogenase-like enzyme